MDRCRACLTTKCQGQWRSQAVSDFELNNPDFIRDVRNFVVDLSKRPAELLDFILDLFARLDGCIVDGAHRPIHLSTDIFLPSDEDIDQGRAGVVEARIRNWLEETFAAPVPAHITPRVRREARERFRIIATILRAAYPRAAIMWGVRPSNDNEPLIP
jgi:hypothetical protein